MKHDRDDLLRGKLVMQLRSSRTPDCYQIWM